MPILQPVIHVSSPEQAFRNLSLVEEAGCEAAWLISHGELNHLQLSTLATAAKDKFPRLWLGVNFLDLSTEHAISTAPHDIQGIWFDDGLPGNPDLARKCADLAKNRNLSTFGGLCFKYQQDKTPMEQAAKEALAVWDFPTTSGSGTGKAPGVEKLKALNQFVPPGRLAVASGISIKNAVELKPYFHYALVASAIAAEIDGKTDFYELDVDKMAKLRLLLK